MFSQTPTKIGLAQKILMSLPYRKALCCLMLHYQTPDPSLKTPIPSASVRAFAVFTGPTPPELTADTLMIYMLLVSIVVFVV